MKRVFLSLGLLLTSAAAFAADPSVLISCDASGMIGKDVTVYSGHVEARFSGPMPMSVRATTMSYDLPAKRMTFTGEVEITGAGQTIRSKEISIDCGKNGANIYMLNPAGIVAEKAAPVPFSAGAALNVGPSVAPATHLSTAKPFATPE